MNLVKPETAPYFQAFRERRAAEPDWLAERRQAGIERFAEAGFPTRRDEAWRFTNLRPLERSVFLPLAAGPAKATEATLAPFRLDSAAARIVLVNGRFAPELSDVAGLPDGVFAGSLGDALKLRPDLARAALEEADTIGRHAFAALNAAFFDDGFVIAFPEVLALERPIEIVHWATAESAASIHGRNLIVAGPGSRASVVETFAGTGPCWSNLVTTIRLDAGAELRHVVLQSQSPEAIHIAATSAAIAAGARYDNFLLTTGGSLSRQDVVATIAGEKASCAIGGVYLLRRAQEATIATFIDHAAPHCETREVVKGVVEDRAHGVFQGKIRVRQEAQKTDARQLNNNLLLSPRAAVDTKPELEIYADDVKCSHGATVGDLDEGALFYLRARGIEEAAARRMLVGAFVTETLDLVADPAIRSHLGRRLDAWLADRKA